MRSPISARRVVVVSLWVDVLDVVTNLVVALVTGSAVVFAEMAQGVADVAGSLLLVIGERRSRRRRDLDHPLGYRREIFFWALLSALVLLGVGAGLSAWRGLHQLLAPEAVRQPVVGLAVLALSTATNGYAVTLSVRRLVEQEGSLRGALRDHGHPLVKTALWRDTVGTLSALLGLGALGLYVAAGAVVFDAVGALVVAVLLVLFSGVLIAQARALITGRAVPGGEIEAIRRAVLDTPGVVALNALAAVYAGSTEVRVELDLALADALGTREIEALLDEIERRVRAAVPETESVRVDLNAAGGPG